MSPIETTAKARVARKPCASFGRGASLRASMMATKPAAILSTVFAPEAVHCAAARANSLPPRYEIGSLDATSCATVRKTLKPNIRFADNPLSRGQHVHMFLPRERAPHRERSTHSRNHTSLPTALTPSRAPCTTHHAHTSTLSIQHADGLRARALLQKALQVDLERRARVRQREVLQHLWMYPTHSSNTLPIKHNVRTSFRHKRRVFTTIWIKYP